MTDRFDLVIIGTGAGGGTLARVLAPTGLRILLLERGVFLPREEENWNSEAVFIESRYKATETWYDKSGREFHPGIHYWVGGNTKVYGAALLRMRSEDFDELPHHGGVSPAWPIRYEDLQPYYLDAERMYSVRGQRGTDPTEPPEDAPYPHPPLEHEPRIQELSDDFEKLGLNPFHLPIGVRMGDDRPYPQAAPVLGRFDGFPDPTESKADAHVVGVAPALQYENVTLRVNCFVDKLGTNATGTAVDSVHVVCDGRKEVITADTVIVACGAVNSAALLLRSANERHPNGLANGSDVVGRHYMCHHNSALLAISKRPNPTRFQKTLGLNDFYFGADDFEFPLGHIQMLGKSDADMLKADAPRLAPGMALDFMAAHSIDFWLTSEDLPDRHNRVKLRPDGSIELVYTENNLEGHTRLTAKLKSMLSSIGCRSKLFPCSVYLGKKIPIAGTAHQCGTIRFGSDPTTSALDVHCKTHELDNLYVVDGSFFVSSSAVNPALTIMANAFRVADHLMDRLGVTSHERTSQCSTP